MRAVATLGVLALIAASGPVQAQSLGSWRVNGAISGRTFVLDCRLEPNGGVCTDVDGKKSHLLASFSAANGQVRWSFSTRVMLMSITLAFAGRIEANHMSGSMTAAGRTGTFTAVRR